MNSFSRTLLFGLTAAWFMAAAAFPLRSILVLGLDRGPGASSDDVKLAVARLEEAVRAESLFTVRSKTSLLSLVDKLGGCQKSACFTAAAKELGVALLVTGNLHKQRDEFVLSIQIIDTKLGEAVMELSETLPKGATEPSDTWLAEFVKQLEPLTVEAEQVVSQGEQAALDAVKATIIMDDELSGKLTRDKSPYLFVKNVVVPANATLIVEPGGTLLMGGDYISFVVFGQVMMNGTADAPIIIRSAKKEPNAWDWDRIYIRGASRSYFSYCRISHSNFGIHADNGNVTLTNCVFENNSIGCLYAIQSNVQIKDTEFGKGHLVGINVDAGADVFVDSGTILNNNRAVICHPYGRIKMSRTRIENNDYGVVAPTRSSITLEDVQVRDNRVGVFAQQEIKSGRLFLVSGNDENLRIGNEMEFKPLLTRPEKITAIKTREREWVDTANFKSDFSSLPSRGESLAARLGLLGQISLGLSYRHVTDLNDQVHPSLPEAELPHEATYVPGLRPEFQIFLQSKTGDRESNLTLNGFGNYFGPRLQETKGNAHLANLEAYRTVSKIEVINLTTKLPGQEIVAGDFSQDKSELSISSRQVRGIRYTRNDNLKAGRRLQSTVLAGQSATPYPVGLKPDMLDSSTTPERQEWLSMASADLELTRDLRVTGQVVGTRHVDDPLLFPGLSFDSTDLYAADPKLRSLSWGGGAKLALNESMTLYAEVDAGFADTLSYAIDSGTVLKDGSVVRHGFSEDTLIEHPMDENNLAGLIGADYTFKAFSGNIEYLHAQKNFYTGGNPSIRPSVGSLNKAHITTGRTFSLNLFNDRIKNIETNAALDWEALATEESGIAPDLFGENKLTTVTSQESYDSLNGLYENFTYKPVENKFKGGLGIKLPISDFSFEPAFSYYYETKTKLKQDAESKKLTLDVDGVEHTVMATEYADAESRMQINGSVIYMPSLPENRYISNARTKLSVEAILTNDRNDKSSGDADSSYWNRNDGKQIRVDGSLSAKFLKSRVANTISGSYKTKDKKYRDEVKVTQKVSDKLTLKLIPRKLTLGITGYYMKTTTDYQEALNDEEGNFLQYAPVNELLTVYGGEGLLTYAFNATFSVSGKGGYEFGKDTAKSGSENYKTFYVGSVVNYLF